MKTQNMIFLYNMNIVKHHSKAQQPAIVMVIFEDGL